MKILLRQRDTDLWLKKSGAWESSKEDAREFAFGTDAIQQAEASRPLEVQVCFEAEDPNVSFELGRERGDFTRPVSRP